MPSRSITGAHASSPGTRERLIDAITAHGPVTARTLASHFGLTSAAVRRHLTALEADGIIAEYTAPAKPRGRGRPSKSFVIASAPRAGRDEEIDDLAQLAVAQLARLGGIEAVRELASQRMGPLEKEFTERLQERETGGERVTPAVRIDVLAEILSEHGYATTVRPLTVSVPAVGSQGSARPRTVVTAQLCQGHCPVQDVAAHHPELCDAETRAISRMLGVPVQRLATLAGGAHACTTHIPLTEGRTS